jgi:hypothetical protein
MIIVSSSDKFNAFRRNGEVNGERGIIFLKFYPISPFLPFLLIRRALFFSRAAVIRPHLAAFVITGDEFQAARMPRWPFG